MRLLLSASFTSVSVNFTANGGASIGAGVTNGYSFACKMALYLQNLYKFKIKGDSLCLDAPLP
jgi:hypothetical protein